MPATQSLSFLVWLCAKPIPARDLCSIPPCERISALLCMYLTLLEASLPKLGPAPSGGARERQPSSLLARGGVAAAGHRGRPRRAAAGATGTASSREGPARHRDRLPL